MLQTMRPLTLVAILFALPLITHADPHLWLEEVENAKALAWVEAHNAVTMSDYADSAQFRNLEARVLSILDSDERIPFVNAAGDLLYNFWRDADNPRGVWRRTTEDEYGKEKPKWETVLDVDALAEAEGENWVFAGEIFLEPSYDRCLVRLSRGGSDAVVIREFDLTKKTFVDAGFHLSEAKSRVAWAGPDSLLVATDFGPGSMTDSGYPRIAKRWKRGQPLEAATTVFEGEQADVSVGVGTELAKGYEMEQVTRVIDFYNDQVFLLRDGELQQIDKPSDAVVTIHRGWIFLEPKQDWAVGDKTYDAGALLAADLDEYLAGKRNLTMLSEPAPGRSLTQFSTTLNHVLINELDNVQSKLYVATPGKDGWTRRALPVADGFRTATVRALDRHRNDRYLLTTTDFVTPATLELKELGSDKVLIRKSTSPLFDARGLHTTQHWATSADGTRIPYFQVAPPDAKRRPTVLYGYGGFEISLLPRYSATTGAGWLEQGGVYVYANIRGGGEFGPDWHHAALMENRPRAYEDFIAVAEHLIERGVTTPKQLGVVGGSNGGLLVGNMLTMRPDLFGAVVCQVPLLDMRRYHKLLAGASWMAEYGNPDDPEQWRFIQGFSPYHNVEKDIDYPAVLFTSSTRDDRVHPGHARKMVAKMESQGHLVHYYENTEGGHAGAADNRQRAFMSALAYRFFSEVLD